MDKKQALGILITNSYLLSDGDKFNLMASLNDFTAEEIEVVGKFLAVEKRIALETSQETLKTLNTLITDLQE